MKLVMDNTDILFKAVVDWGRARKISSGTTQTVKLLEEAGEVAHEISRGAKDMKALADAIGDTMVVLTILADIYGLDARSCMEYAYGEIRDRKGKLVNGGFVKDEES